jgi:DNA helicase-2/ATP-dependent DNA helicase PcrA
MQNYDINSLNEEQRLALNQIEGAILVTAGAGSGKTKLLTHRVAFLIDSFKVSPYEILAITFTNKASQEMKERISKMVEGADRVWISTFHSMCAKILRHDIDFMPPFSRNFSIYSESDADKVIKEVIEESGFDNQKDKLKKLFSFHLSNWKNDVLSLGEYLNLHSGEDEIRKIGILMQAYEEKLEKNNALDFDDLLRKTYLLFKSCPEVLNHYSNRFRYVLVDEFQDTNTIQYELVKMLCKVHGNVFVVGDEDQCIYSWRGANFKNIFNFKKDFPDVKVFKLERNYRSTASILQVANSVIKNNLTRLDKKMWTEKGEGEKPSLYNAYDERDEALYVAKTIERLHSQGYNYDEMAVLMRMNALSRAFEEAFLSYNIPHRIYGGFKFYERNEIKNVIAYLRLFVNPKDDISLERIINFPKRSIGDVAVNKIKLLSQGSMLETILSDAIKTESAIYKKLQTFIETFNFLKFEKQNPLSSFVEKVIKKFEIYSAFSTKSEEDLNRIMNIEQFISSVKEFEALNPEADLGAFLESITLKSDNDEIGQGGAVTIATIHAVKGLEFKAVFVIGLEEGILPISRAIGNNSELEEERRLMYVALTRAEEKLYLSHVTKRYIYRESQYQMPSRFCKELGLIELERKSAGTFASRSFGECSGGGYGSFGNGNFGYGTGGNFSGENFVKSTFNKDNFFREEKKYVPEKDISIYKVGQKVIHTKYGEGEIVEISSDGLVGDIIFDGFGKKSLMLELAPLEILED